MSKDALNNFANILLKEASDKKKETAARLDKERKEKLKAADTKLNLRFEQQVKLGIAEMQQQMRLSLTRREMDLHKALLQNRQRTFDAVFSAVTENIRAFTQTPGYEDFMKQEFSAAITLFSQSDNNLVCTVMKKDIELAEKLFCVSGLTIVSTEKDFIGGFTLEHPTLHRFADCTLESRIEMQKQNFLTKSDLIIA